MFCFKCPYCGYRMETPVRDPAPTCTHGMQQAVCGESLEETMVRDWQAEGVGVGTGVRVSRDGTLHDQASLFLPDNDEFKGPGDPDGTKGMREWRENHGPRPTNTKPFYPGTVERKVY